MNSKAALDKIIRKSRVHLYKPIQIAEILYHHRIDKNVNLLDLESYRNVSKKWRDEVTKQLIGAVSTSSQRFQDNLFEANAMPLDLLNEIARYNSRNGGIVENYIYHQLSRRLAMVFEAFTYVSKSSAETFDLDKFLSLFTTKPGLKRSIDKAYEITVYALFSAIVRALRIEVSLSIKNANKSILSDFDKFVQIVLGLSKTRKIVSIPAKLFRVGVTNAADRGLDIWANFGTAVQVKHISLSEELADDVADNLSADRIVLVCLDGEAEMIAKITKQLPYGSRIHGIINLSDLKHWYGLCLSKKYNKLLGAQLLSDLKREFNNEFPSTSTIEPFLSQRGYLPENLKGEWVTPELE